MEACFDIFDDFSLLDNLVYDDNFDLPSLDQPLIEEDDTTTRGGDHALFFPGVDTELDRELSIFHLLKAYGEATQIASSSTELARVISARVHEKSSPVGTTSERLGHYLLPEESDPQAEFLNRESAKSYPLALRAFYEITPYGRFAHFVANAAILESVPRDVLSVRIVDLDVGEGVQWPPLLASLGPHRSVRITCIGGIDDKYFYRTKERLLGFARTVRIDLKVDRLSKMDELVLEKKGEWLVFNCMAGLPHMGGMGSSKKGLSQMGEFTKVANELIASSGRRGVMTYAIGCGFETKLFSDEHLLRSRALFESMESHFPSQKLSLARTAMECLFVGPCVSSDTSLGRISEIGSVLDRLVISRQSWLEAEEIGISRGGGEYGVRVVGDCRSGNELVLEWRGTPLVRVSAWS